MAIAAVGTAIGAGASIAGAANSGSASKKAARQQIEAINQAKGDITNVYNQNRSDMLPWLGTGQQANSLLALGLGMGDTGMTVKQAQNQLKQAQDALAYHEKNMQMLASGQQIPQGSERWNQNVANFTALGLNPSPATAQAGLQELQQAVSQRQQQLQQAQQIQTMKQNGTFGGLLRSFGQAPPNFQPFTTPVPQYKNFTTPVPQYKNFTAQDMYQYDPGYQFRINQGLQAVNNSAAAKGSLLSGGTLKDLNNYAQSQASSEFQNAFDRYNQQYANKVGAQQNSFNQYNQQYANKVGAWQNSLNQYMQNFGMLSGNWADKANFYNNNRNTIYRMLTGTSGSGQQQSQALGTLGSNYANSLAGLTTGAGNAAAAATIGAANAWNGAAGNIGNSLTSLAALRMLRGAQT